MTLLFACKNEVGDVMALDPDDYVNVERVTDVEIYYSDSAVVRVKISGPTLLNILERERPREEFPDGVRAEFYDANSVIQSTLTAKKGTRYSTNENRVVVRDSVVVLSKNGERLETEELEWNEKTQLITSDKFVRIIGKDEVIYGYGLEADQDFSRYKINAVTGRIKADDFTRDLTN